MKNLEDNLAEVLSSCEYVDQAIENATPTQLLLVRKQVSQIRGRRIKVSGDLNCSDRSGFLLDEVLEGAER